MEAVSLACYLSSFVAVSENPQEARGREIRRVGENLELA